MRGLLVENSQLLQAASVGQTPWGRPGLFPRQMLLEVFAVAFPWKPLAFLVAASQLVAFPAASHFVASQLAAILVASPVAFLVAFPVAYLAAFQLVAFQVAAFLHLASSVGKSSQPSWQGVAGPLSVHAEQMSQEMHLVSLIVAFVAAAAASVASVFVAVASAVAAEDVLVAAGSSSPVVLQVLCLAP